MGKVLGIVNRKGGVGKTTTATTLSYLLSKEGCKVALIDFDGQRHTTKLCGVTAPEQLSVTIYDILKCIVMNEELPDKGSYMIRTETGVDLIPANNKLDNFDKLMCDTDFAEYFHKCLFYKFCCFMFSCTVSNNLPVKKINQYTDIIPAVSYPYVGQITYHYIAVWLVLKLSVQHILYF